MTVAALMLHHDRGGVALPLISRSWRCFSAQVHAADTMPYPAPYLDETPGKRPIGTVRNTAIRASNAVMTDIICHWDSDEWHDASRIAEQVALLQSTGADVVGYRSMLFADIRNGKCEAWLYRSTQKDYCIGTSLCYWRKTWEAVPFPPLPDPNNWQSACEDTVWQTQVKLAGMKIAATEGFTEDSEPKMIATVHGSNTRLHIIPHAREWMRRPDWDERTRKILEFA